MYYMMSGIGWAVSYYRSRDCFEHCALVLLSAVARFLY